MYKSQQINLRTHAHTNKHKTESLCLYLRENNNDVNVTFY